MNKNKYFIIASFSIIFISALFAGYISAVSLFDKSRFAELKTYKNNTFNFNIIYPSDYIIYQEGPDFVQFVYKKYKNIEGEIPSIMIKVIENNEAIDVSDWFEKKLSCTLAIVA